MQLQATQITSSGERPPDTELPSRRAVRGAHRWLRLYFTLHVLALSILHLNRTHKNFCDAAQTRCYLCVWGHTHHVERWVWRYAAKAKVETGWRKESYDDDGSVRIVFQLFWLSNCWLECVCRYDKRCCQAITERFVNRKMLQRQGHSKGFVVVFQSWSAREWR